MLAVAKQKASARKIIDANLGPDLPPLLGHIWAMYTALDCARTGNGFGPNPISYSEMDAYARLSGVTLATWEVNALKRLDLAYLRTLAEERERNENMSTR